MKCLKEAKKKGDEGFLCLDEFILRNMLVKGNP